MVERYEFMRPQGGEKMELAGILFSIGMLLSLIGFAFTSVGTIWRASQRNTEEEETRRIGGLVMIGPIPIIFGSDSKISGLLVKIAVGLFILFFMLLLIPPFFW